MIYRRLVRPLLFRCDAERAHHAMIAGARLASRVPALPHALFSPQTDRRLESSLCGMTVHSPLGLAAGLDKNGEAIPFFASLGFGFIEIGSVTALPQSGNEKPRVFRAVESSAIINRMGFPSEGAERMAQRLAELKVPFGVRLGINIGKSKVAALEQASEDYLTSFRKLRHYGDYFVLNVSSPNTPELRKLQEPERLAALFSVCRECLCEGAQPKPLLVKIAPDLSWQEIDDILDVSERCGVSGIIATNTTLSREGLAQRWRDERGGLSGPPLRARAREVVAYLFRRTQGKLPIVGVGGVSSASDVLSMIRAGASVVQLYTALVYEGPGVARTILRELSETLSAMGISSISELRGK